jgi:hypothetical protein
MAVDWTDEQNDAIVADYFAMLEDDIHGRPYSKAEHNRALQRRIDRPRGSIEYKHQNISAVLKGLGQTWISGYKPAFNFQMSLVDAVVRWLDRTPEAIASNAFSPPPCLEFRRTRLFGLARHRRLATHCRPLKQPR